MKALTVKQPCASLIVDGTKTIELRTWTTRHLERIAIHAGKSWDDRGSHHMIAAPFGQILGTVEICGVEPASLDMWEETGLLRDDLERAINGARIDGNVLYAWRLRNPRRIAPIALTGRLGLWDLSPELEQAVLLAKERR